MTDLVQLLLAQCSQKFTLSQKARAADLRLALTHAPHFIGFTELGDNDDLATTRRVLEAEGYRFYGDITWSCGVGVREDVVHVDAGYRAVHGPAARVQGKGGYRARGIIWARGMVDGREDLDTWFGEFHSVTWAGGTPDRVANRAAMARAVAEELTANGLGPRLAFAAGDTNEADEEGAYRPQAKTLHEAGLVTCWDELGKYPSTSDGGRRAIDWLIRRQGDTRTRFTGVKVVNQPHVDHHLILGTVEVRPLKPKPCPTCGQTLPS